MNVVSFSELRNSLKEIMDAATDQYEPVVIRRPGGDMVLLSLRDYESLQETLYLLGHEANAAHLRRSLASARAGKVQQKPLKK